MRLPPALRRAGPALLSAILLALAFPPFNLSLLVFVALAPWIASLRHGDGKQAVRSSLFFGALCTLFQMFWLVPFVSEWTHKPGLALVPWLVCGVLGALLYLPLGWLIQQCWKLKWPLLIPLVWAGHEGFRAYVPVLAFPWGIVANPLWLFPQFVQHAAFGTVFFVSAWVIVPNLVASSVLWPPKDEDSGKAARTNIRLALVFGGIMVASAFRYAMPPETVKKVVTLGQPGVDMAFLPREDRRMDLAAEGNLIQARAVAQGTSLLVLPEGFVEEDPRLPPYSPIGPRPVVPVIMGGKRPLNGHSYQTAFAYDGQWSYADKTRLVVFGEYVPFRGLPFLSGFNLPSGDLVAGKELKTLEVNGMTLGPLLCFEGVFPDLAERHCRLGAQMLVQMSIDDWYERTPAWEQLWQSSVWRSIESGLPLARVGGRGRTLATDVRGNIVAFVPKGIRAAARVEMGLPVRSDAFPYRMAFVYLCWAVCGGVALTAWYLPRLLRKADGRADE